MAVETTRSLREAALYYAQERDWAVLPLEPRGKRPLWHLGWEDASTDALLIGAWWDHQPEANVGVACVGALVVLDIDGQEGERLLADMEREVGEPIPRTHVVHTGRGRHLYFQRPASVTDGWRYGGLELKASGYVVAPPSVHPSGQRYCFVEE